MYRFTLHGVLVLALTISAAAQESTPQNESGAGNNPDPSGTWTWDRTFGEYQMDYTLQLMRNAQGQLTGTYAVKRDDSEREPVTLDGVTLEGNKLTFHVHRTRNDREFTISYEGIISGDTIEGISKANFGGEDREFEWMARRVASSAAEAKWISLFDGRTMEGWERVGNAQSVWEVKDGALTGSGPASMLVNTTGPYKNFRYRAEVKINDLGNSGLYFRTTRQPGFTDGYEAQIDSTHSDPIRTGSLYGMCHVYKQHVAPDTWFTYELEVRDDVWRGRNMTRIKVTIDDNELYEYLDFALTFKEGYFAFQHHDPGSKVSIRKVEVMPLP